MEAFDYKKAIELKDTRNYNTLIDYLKIYKDDSDALYLLAQCYIKGMGVKPDVVEYMYYLNKSAQLNNRDAMYEYGKLLLKKEGINHALHYLELAGDQYHEAALLELVSIFSFNSDEHFRRVSQLESLNHPVGLYEMGQYLKIGFKNLLEKNEEKAFDCFKKASKQGHVNAVLELFECYGHGIGCQQNDENAILVLKEFLKQKSKISEADYMRIRNKLGICYFEGIYVQSDLEKAYEYFAYVELPWFNTHFYGEKCIKGEAYYYLGRYHQKSFKIGHEKKAIEYYHKAIDHDYKLAHNQLMNYAYETGIKTSYHEQTYYYEIAAELGHKDALKKLIYKYCQGYEYKLDKALLYSYRYLDMNDDDLETLKIVAHFFSEIAFNQNKKYYLEDAIKCYKKLAELGWIDASLHLAKCYYKSDLSKCLQYIKDAVHMNSSYAKLVLSALTQRQGAQEEAAIYYHEALKDSKISVVYKEGYKDEIKVFIPIIIELLTYYSDINDLNALKLLGDYYYILDKDNQYKRAIPYYQKILDKVSNDNEIYQSVKQNMDYIQSELALINQKYIEENMQEALNYLNLAKDAGSDIALKMLELYYNDIK